MLLRIVAVGKLKEAFLQAGVAEYRKRIQAYGQLEILEVPDQKIPDNPTPGEIQTIRAKEAAGLEKYLPSTQSQTLVVLDQSGKSFRSEELADWMQEKMLDGKSGFTWVIGGTLGLDRRIVQKADLLLSFSHFTFPHQLMRLILTEQIYRSFKIIRQEPYHR